MLVTIIMVGTITFVIVLILIVIRIKLDLSDELFRKLMHLAALIMTPLDILFSDNNYIASAVLFIIGLLSEIGLRIFPRLFDINPITDKSYEAFFVEREAGEIRQSFVGYTIIQAVIILICTVFYDFGVILMELLVWGIGDAIAALVGKTFGNRRINIGDNNKTYIGSASMFTVSLIITFFVLNIIYPMPLINTLIESVVIAIAATFTELISKKGIDTITIPAVVTVLGICLNSIFY